MSHTEFECPEVKSYLPLFVGEDLDRPLSTQVRAHLQRCGACSENLAALRAALGAFDRERERVDPVVNLWPSIERELTGAGVIATSVSQPSSAIATLPARAEAPLQFSARAAALSTRAVWLRRVTLLAAAAGLALVAWRWANDASPRSSTPLGAVEGEVALSVPRPGEPSSAGSALQSTAPRAGADSSRREVALVSDSTVPAAQIGDESSARNVGQAAQAPLRPADGLRRVQSDEALLRDSIELNGAHGDYSLAGSRGLR